MCPSYNTPTVQSQAIEPIHVSKLRILPTCFQLQPGNENISLQNFPAEHFLSVKTEVARAAQCRCILMSFEAALTGLNRVQRKAGIYVIITS